MPKSPSFPEYFSQNEAKARLARVFEAAGCRTQMELAAFLGIRQSSISDAKRRGVIPSDWLLTLLRLRGVNPEWVLSGEKVRLLCPVETDEKSDSPVCCQGNVRPPEQCSTQELFTELVRRALKDIKGETQ